MNNIIDNPLYFTRNSENSYTCNVCQNRDVLENAICDRLWAYEHVRTPCFSVFVYPITLATYVHRSPNIVVPRVSAIDDPTKFTRSGTLLEKYTCVVCNNRMFGGQPCGRSWAYDHLRSQCHQH